MTRHRRRVLLHLISLALAGLFLSAVAHAAAYTPAAPDEILLELSAETQQTALALARSRSTTDKPADAVIAAQLAQQFVSLGRSQSDERYFGYAAATLQPWIDSNVADQALANDITILMADIAQHQHRFADANQILDELLTRDRSNARATLLRAAVSTTRGQLQQAQLDCRSLFTLKQSFAATICVAQVASLTGRLDASYAVVSSQLQGGSYDANTDAAKQYLWALGVAGEMAERKGDLPAAKRWFQKAIALDPTDLVSRLQLSDVLLRTNEAQQAIALLQVAPASEPVLLRRALAAQQLNERPLAKRALEDWQAAVSQNAQLGIRLHLRELARGELELLHAPRQALKTALENWEVQREPADVRVLVACALAAGDTSTLEAVKRWQQKLNFEDTQLARL